MLIAILEKRAGISLANYDSYINIVGGMKILEPSLDSAILVALLSSYKNKPFDPYTIVFGEIGLTGELRAVNMSEKRVSEAHKLGFKTCVLPQANLKGLKKFENMKVLGVSNVSELFDLILNSEKD